MKRSVLFLLVFALVLVCLPVAAGAAEVADVLPSALSASELPSWQGEDWITVHNGIPDFYLWQLTNEPYVHFSPLDRLGRTGPAMACLGPETLPSETRGVIGDIRPSGWHTVRYDDLIEDMYLYNRSHVIAHMLCGDSGTAENLFTGTRYLNAGTMAEFEIRTGNYIEGTGNHVLYRVSPVYAGDDLVASGVQMEAWSLEDMGRGLCFNVFLYNIQPGIGIDYRTGESWRSDGEDAPSAFSVLPVLPLEPFDGRAVEADRSLSSGGTGDAVTEEPAAVTYVLNTNTKKFHDPSCPSVGDMKAKNRQDFFGTREEALAAGYSPCGRCRP